MKVMRVLLLGIALAMLAPPMPRSFSHEGHDHGFMRRALDPGKVVLSTEAQKEIGLKTQPVRRGSMNITLKLLAGHVEAAQDRTFDINPPVSGVVKEVRAMQGDVVAAGSPLAVIRSTELAAAVAKLLDERAKIQAEKALAKIRLEKEIAIQVVEFDLVQSKYSRTEKLEKVLAVSKEALEVARADLNKARVKLNSLQAQLTEEVAILDARLQQVTDAVRSETRVMGLSDKDFDRAVATNQVIAEIPILSPVSGVVTFRDFTAGESFDPKKKVFTVLDLRQVWVVVDIFQDQLSSIEIGQSVSISTTSNESYRGNISSVGSVVDATSRTVPVRIVVDNPDFVLRPGMFATGEVTLQTVQDTLLIPVTAVISDKGKSIVFTKRDEFFFHAVRVSIGATNGQLVEIIGGVRENDEVVVGDAALQLYGNSLLNKQLPAVAPRSDEQPWNRERVALVIGVGVGLVCAGLGAVVVAFLRRKRSG